MARNNQSSNKRFNCSVYINLSSPKDGNQKSNFGHRYINQRSSMVDTAS